MLIVDTLSFDDTVPKSINRSSLLAIVCSDTYLRKAGIGVGILSIDSYNKLTASFFGFAHLACFLNVYGISSSVFYIYALRLQVR